MSQANVWHELVLGRIWQESITLDTTRIRQAHPLGCVEAAMLHTFNFVLQSNRLSSEANGSWRLS